MHKKHVPLRTCIACRQVRPKREMVRIVRAPEGGLVVDERGKAAGRGAYLCRARSCWALAMRGGRLEHALRAPVSEEEREMLRAYSERFPETQPEPTTDG
jgi:predicted RNA-binding protein YlxR (DUF448 family)